MVSTYLQAPLEPRGKAFQILMNFGCEVGVGADGVAPGHCPHHGHDLAGQRHLGEAETTSQGAYSLLVIGPSEGDQRRDKERRMRRSWNENLLCNSTTALQYILSLLSR